MSTTEDRGDSVLDGEFGYIILVEEQGIAHACPGPGTVPLPISNLLAP
jgi:hypothetical protein